MAAPQRRVPVVHYADPDDLDAAMQRLHDLENRDREGDERLGHEVIGGCYSVRPRMIPRDPRAPCSAFARTAS